MIDSQQRINFEDMYLARTYQKIPVEAVRALGSRIWDSKGKEYLDFMSGYGVAILGHSNPRVIEALNRQMETISIAHASVYNPARADFLRELATVMPFGLNRALLTNSGTESVEAALKIAIKATGRKKLVSMERSYHGKTLGSLSVTHSNKYRKAFSDILIPSVDFIKFGDSLQLENTLKNDDVAAVILEPVQGEGGINIPPPEYLRSVRELTENHGTILIMDEIQSGLGRTGKMWAHQHYDIVPDIMTVGKGIGGGIPMGVTIGKSEFVDMLEIGEHTSTTGGNPLACAAGVAVLKELKSGLLDKVRSSGEFLLSAMNDQVGGQRLVSQIRGIGLMIAVELRVRFLPVLMEIIKSGLITLYSGTNTIRMLPPYIVTKEEMEEAVSIMKSALNKILERSKVV